MCPVAYRLYLARYDKRLTQKALGISIGIPEESASARMCQYETGKHIPDFATLQLIADVLNKPVCWFYAVDDQMADVITKHFNKRR